MQSGFDKGPRQRKHCGRNNHISEKCWEKFGHSECVQLVDTDSSIPGGATHPFSTTPSGSSGSSTVMLLQDEYDRMCELESSQTSHLVADASFSGMNAYIVSPQKSCILDSGALSHMSGIKQKFISLYLSNKFSSVNINDGT